MTKQLWGASLALLFLVAHLTLLPSTLEDVDSMNFALGIHDFDPAKHQPHPPGYPVLIALAKTARVFISSDAGALAVLGAVFGALAVFPLIVMFGEILTLHLKEQRRGGSGPATRQVVTIAALGTLLTVTSPLYWFNALRPMSDIPGLALSLAAQAAFVSAYVRQRLNPDRSPEALADSGTRIVLGAFLSALAVGMRSQAVWLTLPLLALVLLQRVGRGAAGALLGSAMTFGIGILTWAVPLVLASGGLAAYRNALNVQGGEDFTGVDMLYRNPTPRRLAFALLDTFIRPWAANPLGWIVFVLAVVGCGAVLIKSKRVALLLAVCVLPYLVFHFLFQETFTTRYALPLIPFVVIAAMVGLTTITGARPAAITACVTMLVVWSMAVTLPPARAYAREGSPASLALSAIHERLKTEPTAAIGMHQGLARSVHTQNFGSAQILPAPSMREWLALADYWKQGNTAPVWFVADPARTDIELIDPLSRTLVKHYTWSFPREQFLGGIRPDIVDLIKIDSPPGWVAEEGWHLTPETLNMSERLGKTDAVAYIWPRSSQLLVALGGESTAPAGGPDAPVSLMLDGQTLANWSVKPGERFFRRFEVNAGAELAVVYQSADKRPAPVRFTQLAIEPPASVFFVQHAGWNEIEYSRELQKRWRWTTGSATTFVNDAGHDVALKISGESPLRYFDAPPKVTVRAGSSILATATPTSDFSLEVKIPSAALRASDGMLTIETDQTFVPHDRNGSPDRRTLGLRIFDFEIR